MQECCTGDFVFPGQKVDKPSLSVTALQMVLRRMRVEGVTVHGFRSAFRDWAAECTNCPNEVCEAALAHAIENKSEAAYRRRPVRQAAQAHGGVGRLLLDAQG